MEEKDKTEGSDKCSKVLADCRKKLDFLLYEGQAICFEVSIDGTIIFVSPAIETISGYKSSELMHRSMWNLHSEMGAREELLAALLKYGRLRDYLIKLRDRDDQVKAFLIDAILLEDEPGRPCGLFGVLKPIGD